MKTLIRVVGRGKTPATMWFFRRTPARAEFYFSYLSDQQNTAENTRLNEEGVILEFAVQKNFFIESAPVLGFRHRIVGLLAYKRLNSRRIDFPS
jgi:hypothetical protein